MLNVGNQPYSGRPIVSEAGKWHSMEPALATIDAVGELPASGLPVLLAARQAVLFVCSP